MTSCQVKSEVAERVDRRHRSLFGSTLGMRQAKALISGPDGKITDQLLEIMRRNIRLAVGLLTGYCRLMQHLHTLGRVDTGTCRKRKGDEETPIHVICNCPELAGKRLKHLGTQHLEPRDVTTFPLDRILALVRDSGLA